MSHEDNKAPFTLEQRDWNSYNTVADAVLATHLKYWVLGF